MEKNTSKAYVEPTSGLVGSALAPASGAGTSLFVINLCASMAPVPIASKTLPGFESYRLYQVARAEDGRTRHRLRLGFFVTEADAETVLAKVREHYPTAFTACLCEEDRRYTRGFVPTAAAPAKPAMTIVPAAAPEKSAPVPAFATKPTAKSASPSAPPAKPAPRATLAKLDVAELQLLESQASAPAIHPGAKAAVTTGKQASLTVNPKSLAAPKANSPGKSPSTPAPKLDSKPDIKSDNAAASMRARTLELSLSDPPPPPAQKTAAASNQPFHVAKGVNLPSTGLSLELEASLPLPNTAKTTSSTYKSAPAPMTPARGMPLTDTRSAPARAVAKPTATPTSSSVPTTKAPHSPVAQRMAATSADLDSTQTIRALTNAELTDEAQEKWFAIQLAASEQPVNLDAMPHLDIFEAYRLYSVAIAGSGKIVHSLRLGFFKEAVSAEAVGGYLKTFFSSPTVLRISVAEQARFKDATAPKKIGATDNSKNAAKVVELNNARAQRGPVPTVTMEVVPSAKIDPNATGSFKLNATGSFRTSDTATHKALTPGLKPAAKNAAPATKRSQPIARKNSTTGKYKIPQKKSLAQQLLEEAQEVELSESGIRKLPKNDSLLSRLVDKLKK